MEYMGKSLKDVIVTLPFADGSSLECGVFAYFQVDAKEYFALLPRTPEGELDTTQRYMIYQVEKDAENNPVVVYIEDDTEYAKAADFFAAKYLN